MNNESNLPPNVDYLDTGLDDRDEETHPTIEKIAETYKISKGEVYILVVM
jgi:hypothetical protein